MEEPARLPERKVFRQSFMPIGSLILLLQATTNLLRVSLGHALQKIYTDDVEHSDDVFAGDGMEGEHICTTNS